MFEELEFVIFIWAIVLFFAVIIFTIAVLELVFDVKLSKVIAQIYDKTPISILLERVRFWWRCYRNGHLKN